MSKIAWWHGARVAAWAAGAWVLFIGVNAAGAAEPPVTPPQTPPQTPVLQFEVGMHVNVVRAVAVDAAGQWAVTASDDKTARVWDLVHNAAGPVLRVPIDPGDEGRLQAVVLTPDGRTVAVAGITGRRWSGSNGVYLFDRASGAMLRRIDTGSPEPVDALALAPDGRTLAVGLGGTAGLRLFDLSTGSPLAQDTDYGRAIYALDFRPDGRHLAVGAADGRLRIYRYAGGQLQRVGGGHPPGGELISQARYSPDGQLLALAFEDSPQALVLASDDLSVVAQPNIGDAPAGAFSSLAWSADGSELWGGGAHRSGDVWLLRVWPRANFASFADRPAAGASILAVTTLPHQRVIFTSAEPGWGLVDSAARVQRRSQSQVANFNSMARRLRIASDARRVRFQYAPGDAGYEFDLAARVLRPAGGSDADTVAPRLTAPGLAIERWENSRGTTLNGSPLPLPPLETARCLAISPDGHSFALGTDLGLWKFDESGHALWSRRTPAVVWAVDQTADGRTLVTAGEDGAIRWYRADDGRELMALLLHADRRRWVLWSPSGYFDAAVGAEDLLGWQINRGAAARPDFFPLRSLRAQLYRPDVLDHLLDAADEAQALAQANAAAGRGDTPVLALGQRLPPTLELSGAVDVQAARHQARLRLRLRTLPDAPLMSLRARADGRPALVQVVGTPPGGNGADEREVLIGFNGEPTQLQLMAENRNGLSAPVVIGLVWPSSSAVTATANAGGSPPAGQAQTTAPPPMPAPSSVPPSPGSTPQLIATSSVTPPAATVVIAPVAPAAPAVPSTPAAPTGPAPPAPPAVATAPLLPSPGTPARPGQTPDFEIRPKLYILAVGVGKFASPEVPTLNLTAKDVQDFVAEMKTQQGVLYRDVVAKVLVDETATRDNIVDGLDWLQKQVTQHDVGMLFVSGHGDNDAKLGYIYVPYNFDFDARSRTAVNMKDFQKTLDSLAGKALFFIDTCHSGAVIGGRSRALSRDAGVSGVVNELIGAESGVVVFSASTGRQEALENRAWGNGAFTKALVEGLKGKADFRQSGRVTYKMLDLYITERVKELTKGEQSPVTQAPGGVPDFPLSVVQ